MILYNLGQFTLHKPQIDFLQINAENIAHLKKKMNCTKFKCNIKCINILCMASIYDVGKYGI